MVTLALTVLAALGTIPGDGLEGTIHLAAVRWEPARVELRAWPPEVHPDSLEAVAPLELEAVYVEDHQAIVFQIPRDQVRDGRWHLSPILHYISVDPMAQEPDTLAPALLILALEDPPNGGP